MTNAPPLQQALVDEPAALAAEALLSACEHEAGRCKNVASLNWNIRRRTPHLELDLCRTLRVYVEDVPLSDAPYVYEITVALAGRTPRHDFKTRDETLLMLRRLMENVQGAARLKAVLSS